MSTYQVTCHTPDNTDPDRRIQGLGGPAFGYLGIDEIIRRIRNNIDAFWTVADRKSVWVVVATRNGKLYLKTEPDGVEPNNLLALPRCP